MSATYSALNRVARKQAGERQRAEARRLAGLAVRGAFEPPRWVLSRLTNADRMEYEAARDEARRR